MLTMNTSFNNMAGKLKNLINRAPDDRPTSNDSPTPHPDPMPMIDMNSEINDESNMGYQLTLLKMQLF